jgi:hypothetical protein
MLKGYVNWAMRRPERFHLIFGRWDREDADLRRVAHEARDAPLRSGGGSTSQKRNCLRATRNG